MAVGAPGRGTLRGRPFLVNVARLVKEGPRREHRLGVLPGLEVTGASVPTTAEVEVDVLLEPVQGGILASGTVIAPWRGACRRCLEEASGVVRAQVRELYEKGSDLQETYDLEGDRLDLEPLARDAVLLELPQAPLCREGCQGLCPTCGAELDQGPCGCPPAGRDPRWAGLDQLREQ
jgi:uncharacterized protein